MLVFPSLKDVRNTTFTYFSSITIQIKAQRSVLFMNTAKKILLAEDNIADVELTKIAFRELNLPLEVVHVSDGQQLLDHLNNLATHQLDDIALILLDLNMPRMGGIDVLKVLYKDDELRRLPVVVFTSSSHDSDIQACYEYGANAYVCKPLDIQDFNQTIQAIANFWGEINVLPSFSKVTL